MAQRPARSAVRCRGVSFGRALRFWCAGQYAVSTRPISRSCVCKVRPSPKTAALGCIEDNQLIYEYGREVAREFRELGVHVNFAPDADVNTNPLNPVIHVRSFGEDPKKVAEKVLAYSRGLESGGVLSVSKHFPGHGVDSGNVDLACRALL